MASHRIRALAVVLLIFAIPTFGADRTVRFNRDVRPILSDKCFGCHGPDSVAKKIPLRLDSEAAASPVVAGGVQAKLIQRVAAEDKARRMPPVYSGFGLTPAEIETLRRGSRRARNGRSTGRSRLPNARRCRR